MLDWAVNAYDFVVAFSVRCLGASPLADCVVGDVEDVVGFMVGEMNLEQVEPVIDGVDEGRVCRAKVWITPMPPWETHESFAIS